jgi:hypothetical protein
MQHLQMTLMLTTHVVSYWLKIEMFKLGFLGQHETKITQQHLHTRIRNYCRQIIQNIECLGWYKTLFACLQNKKVIPYHLNPFWARYTYIDFQIFLTSLRDRTNLRSVYSRVWTVLRTLNPKPGLLVRCKMKRGFFTGCLPLKSKHRCSDLLKFSFNYILVKCIWGVYMSSRKKSSNVSRGSPCFVNESQCTWSPPFMLINFHAGSACTLRFFIKTSNGM